MEISFAPAYTPRMNRFAAGILSALQKAFAERPEPVPLIKTGLLIEDGKTTMVQARYIENMFDGSGYRLERLVETPAEKTFWNNLDPEVPAQQFEDIDSDLKTLPETLRLLAHHDSQLRKRAELSSATKRYDPGNADHSGRHYASLLPQPVVVSASGIPVVPRRP